MARTALACAAALVLAGAARADAVRYHYVPLPPGGQVALKPGPGGAQGEWQPYRGSSVRQPCVCPLQPNYLVTFRHPYTGGLVSVPLKLPVDSTARVEHVGSRLVFNYGSYTVEAEFFPDGSVDILYNGGPGRPAF